MRVEFRNMAAPTFGLFADDLPTLPAVGDFVQVPSGLSGWWNTESEGEMLSGTVVGREYVWRGPQRPLVCVVVVDDRHSPDWTLRRQVFSCPVHGTQVESVAIRPGDAARHGAPRGQPLDMIDDGETSDD